MGRTVVSAAMFASEYYSRMSVAALPVVCIHAGHPCELPFEPVNEGDGSSLLAVVAMKLLQHFRPLLLRR